LERLDASTARAGGGGVSGRNLALHLEKCAGYDAIYAVARRQIAYGTDTVRSSVNSIHNCAVSAPVFMWLCAVASVWVTMYVQIEGLSLDLQNRDDVIQAVKSKLQNITHVW
jgi:hypothetical protein